MSNILILGASIHCGRKYKYGMEKGKKEPLGVGMELEILIKRVMFNICFLALSVVEA